MALYIKKTINCTLRNDLTLMNEGIFESLFIDTQFGNDKITCGTIYRAPKQDRFSNNQFKVQLKNALSTLNVFKNKAYIMGDLNYDLLQDSHTFTDDFVDIMYDHSFYPIMNKPTRITQSSSTCIDHIWTNIHDKNISSSYLFIYQVTSYHKKKTATSSRSITKASKYAIPLKPNTQTCRVKAIFSHLVRRQRRTERSSKSTATSPS